MTKEHEGILVDLIAMEAAGKLDRACFTDLPVQVYHDPRCPGISSTAIKTILKRTWAHHEAHADPTKESFRIGSAFHCFATEPNRFRDEYIICPFEYKRGHDWKEFKARAESEQRIILMPDELSMVAAMNKRLWAHPDSSPLLIGAQFEVTYFSRDQQSGVLKKARVDAITKTKKISDLKSTFDASPEGFRRDCINFFYRISAAYYLEVASGFYGEQLTEFNLISCEKGVPYEISVYEVAAESLATATEEIRTALAKIQHIQQNPQAWRGYELGKKMIKI